MARPFDDTSFSPMGSMASQTILDDPRDKRKIRPRIPKIKSSEGSRNHDAARTSPTFVPDYLLQTSGSSLPSAHALPDKSSKRRIKAKPLLRKFASQEQVGVDLSRSAAENEGFYEAKRGYHTRTTSGTSQISTTSSTRYPYPNHHRTGLASYKSSMESDSDLRKPNAGLPALHIRTGSSYTNPGMNSSQTNLPGTPSSLRYPAHSHSHHNTNNGDWDATNVINSPSSAISYTARSSLDSAFRTKRSRSNTAQTADPAQQAAGVQQLRQKFQEKEAAKDRKYAQAEAKAAEKEQRRRDRKTGGRSGVGSEKSSVTGVPYSRPGTAGRVAGGDGLGIIGGGGYARNITRPGTAEPPTLYPGKMTDGGRGGGGERGGGQSAGKKVHSQWTLFWMRVRTMWLKLTRKMSGSGSGSGNGRDKSRKKKKGGEKSG